MSNEECRPCSSGGCNDLGTHIVVSNKRYYCRKHYKQVLRRHQRKDQTMFVLEKTDAPLTHGPHAGAHVEYKIGKEGKTFWLSISHEMPDTKKGLDTSPRRRTLSLTNLHEDDLRKISAAMQSLVDKIENRENGLDGKSMRVD